MTGYKVFNPDFTCRGFKYEVGKTYKHDGPLSIRHSGFHFCREVADCFNYYSFDPKNKVAEIEATGLVESDGDKSVTNEITIVREIPWEEMLAIANTGKGCTGLKNTGNRNTGNRNTGNWNTGNRNTGNRNTGNRNTGNWNTGDGNTGDWNNGDWNTGNRNTGNCNTGICNTGDGNTGDWNTGNWNTRDWNTGDCNTGICNTGDCNTGNRNTGICNTGDWNTGDCNTGNRNTGDRNTGNWNTGNRNTGDGNTGNRNTGNWNTGDWNTGNWNTGFFSTITPKVTLFEKPTDMTCGEVCEIPGIRVLNWNYENNWWIYSQNMTEEEKTAHPEYETLGGYPKSIPFKDACALMWKNLTEGEKAQVKAIPNFDADIFYRITGIEVETE